MPSDSLLKELLHFAQELGREAAGQLQGWQGRATVGIKEDGSVGTEADRSVDRFLCREIGARYPEHRVLSEEGDTIYHGQPFTWVIDPLDGSTNYALGVCYWGCSIAVTFEGMPVVGVLVVPHIDAHFWAIQGRGAFLNGERLGGAPKGINERNSFLAVCSRTWRYLEVPLPQKARLLGSAAYDLAAVAQGIAVGCTQVTSHVWDLAAGWLLLQEAGRRIGPLLPGAPEPFPLIPGTDYGHRIFPLAAAADERTFQTMVKKIRIKPHGRERLDRWADDGWRK